MRYVVLCTFFAFVGCNSELSRMDPQTVAPAVPAVSDEAASETTKLKTVAVTVTGMMCPHGCYPEVKKLIASSNETESIELTPQEKKDVIDNPVVLVKYRGELNKEAITKAILEAGFEKVEYADK